MQTLLVQSCSASKQETTDPVPALDLYTGYFYRIIKKARRENAVDPSIDLCILSAKHGVVDPETALTTYDQRMTPERADEIAPNVKADLRQRITEQGYGRVVINCAQVYQRALDGFDMELACETYWVTGRGNGEKGRKLKQFLRGDESVLDEMATEPECPA